MIWIFMYLIVGVLVTAIDYAAYKQNASLLVKIVCFPIVVLIWPLLFIKWFRDF